MNTFDTIYHNLLTKIMSDGIKEKSKRNGHETIAVPGLTFSIDIEKEGFPLLTLRKLPLKVFIAEQIWFISGSRKPSDFLREHTKIWDSFTNPGDVVTVAYGYRWRRHFGRDQLKLLVDLLTHDPSSRHGVIITWDPSSDGLGGITKKNVPCPYSFTVNIIGGKLHLHNIVRSNDMVLGFPHDVAGFALLQIILAQKLNVKPGVYTHTISNAHVWDDNYKAAQEILKRTNDHPPLHFELPLHSYDRSEQKDSLLVDEIFSRISEKYNPLEKIEGLSIVV